MDISRQKVVCVSAGMLEAKKNSNPLAKHHRYLNYGLLGIASIADSIGAQVLCTCPTYDTPHIVASTVSSWFGTGLPLVLLSVPSYHSIGWSAIFCSSLKEIDPSIRIVAGGRWVMDQDWQWVASKLPNVDLFVAGLAEDRVREICSYDWCKSSGPNVSFMNPTPVRRPIFPHLNYQLLQGRHDFTPSVEVSRGCGSGCVFCPDSTTPLSPIRSPHEVVQAMLACFESYATTDLRFYFEAAQFRGNGVWADTLAEHLGVTGVIPKWRCETRVDSLHYDNIAKLAAAGLGAIDIGLESASAKQLIDMGKTRSPGRYLCAATDLLRACSDNGILTKVNVLLYPGETKETIDETMEWMARHLDYIDAVSANTFILYRCGKATQSIITQYAELGASVADPASLSQYGFSPLHLSSEVDADTANAVALDISRMVMNARDYFNIKSFGYFPRSLSYSSFLCDALSANHDLLPFRIDDDDLTVTNLQSKSDRTDNPCKNAEIVVASPEGDYMCQV